MIKETDFTNSLTQVINFSTSFSHSVADSFGSHHVVRNKQIINIYSGYYVLNSNELRDFQWTIEDYSKDIDANDAGSYDGCRRSPTDETILRINIIF